MKKLYTLLLSCVLLQCNDNQNENQNIKTIEEFLTQDQYDLKKALLGPKHVIVHNATSKKITVVVKRIIKIHSIDDTDEIIDEPEISCPYALHSNTYLKIGSNRTAITLSASKNSYSFNGSKTIPMGLLHIENDSNGLKIRDSNNFVWSDQ